LNASFSPCAVCCFDFSRSSPSCVESKQTTNGRNGRCSREKTVPQLKIFLRRLADVATILVLVFYSLTQGRFCSPFFGPRFAIPQIPTRHHQNFGCVWSKGTSQLGMPYYSSSDLLEGFFVARACGLSDGTSKNSEGEFSQNTQQSTCTVNDGDFGTPGPCSPHEENS
jgi:hypothetical protein